MRRFKKNNNLAKVFYSVFGSLPLLVTLYLYPLIPENIPVHYWFDGSIDKWGNKNELFKTKRPEMARKVEEREII